MTNGTQESLPQVGRLLAGAASTVRAVRYCWLLTAAKATPWHVRPMGRLQRDPEAVDWRIRFVADFRSRKVRDIRGTDTVTAIFQQGDAGFAALSGAPLLRRDASEAKLLLQDSFEVYFPTADDRANAAVIEVDTTRMELWIRGVTPEPFGRQATRLEREVGREWRVAARDP